MSKKYLINLLFLFLSTICLAQISSKSGYLSTSKKVDSKFVRLTKKIALNCNLGQPDNSINLVKFQSSSFDYVICQANEKGLTNCSAFPVPNMPRPPKGVPFVDPVFHTTITRITDWYEDGLAERRKREGRSPLRRPVLNPEYSRPDIENADGTKLLISIKEFCYFLYDANTLQMIKPLTHAYGGKIRENVEGSIEPRWDDEDPNVFYYHRAMSFYKYDISTDKITLIRDFSNDFPGGWRIFFNGGGNPSLDRRHWAFMVQTHGDWIKIAIFTYDLEQDRIIGRMKIEDYPNYNKRGLDSRMHMISISPYGDRVIVEWSHSPTKTMAYDLDFTNPVEIGDDGHTSSAIDAEGNQVYLIKDNANDVIAMIDIKTGKRTNLLKLPLSGDWDTDGSYHFSGNNYEKPGWAAMSTYGATTQDKWFHYKVFMLELKKNPRIWMIANTHGKREGYWTSPKATINRKGTKIFWGSNWNDASAPVCTYQATLPKTWWEDLINK